MRIWITRAQPEADATAERVRDTGHAPVVAPVLEVRPAGRAPGLDGVGALAFTSRNGVRAFAVLHSERGLPVFTVGDATAHAAREAGFLDVTSASGDVDALAVLIAGRKFALDGEVLYLAPEEPAGDLVGMLSGLGVPARAAIVYRTAPADFAVPTDIDLVLVHSARAARRLAEDPAFAAAAARITAICISAAAAEPLQGLGLREVLAAPQPNETAMLEAFQSWAARQPPPRLFTPMFWVAISFAMACIVAAILVAGLGPRLFPLRVHRPAPARGSAASNPHQFGLRPPSPSGPP